jgi:uncharacterized protein (UPF0332 family)
MPFDWGLYLNTARSLAANTNDEAALRSAVSRAYYAAFGLASLRAVAENKHVPSTGEAHAVVWKHFESASDRFRKKIGADGKRLRWRRRQADYDASAKISSAEVSDSLNTADSIIRFLALLK